MVKKQLFTNNAVSLLSVPLGVTDTLLVLMTGHGSLFPTPQANEFFTVTLENEAATIQEIVYVTQRDGDVLTIQRAQEGTTAHAWTASSGADTLVDHRLTAWTLDRLQNTYTNSSFQALTDYREALDYLLQGNPTSGGEQVDANVTTQVVDNETIITTPSAFKSNTTKIYVGGLRQKRGVDYFEVGTTELRLQFILSDELIADGQNIVVDYVVL